jgi:hypothetical protein
MRAMGEGDRTCCPTPSHAKARKAGVDIPGYSSPQVCEMTGLTYRQLDYWNRTGRAQTRERCS